MPEPAPQPAVEARVEPQEEGLKKVSREGFDRPNGRHLTNPRQKKKRREFHRDEPAKSVRIEPTPQPEPEPEPQPEPPSSEGLPVFESADEGDREVPEVCFRLHTCGIVFDATLFHSSIPPRDPKIPKNVRGESCSRSRGKRKSRRAEKRGRRKRRPRRRKRRKRRRRLPLLDCEGLGKLMDAGGAEDKTGFYNCGVSGQYLFSSIVFRRGSHRHFEQLYRIFSVSHPSQSRQYDCTICSQRLY